MEEFSVEDDQMSVSEGSHQSSMKKQEIFVETKNMFAETKKSQPMSTNNQSDRQDLLASNFFDKTGMPKFSKQWLDNFITDAEL